MLLIMILLLILLELRGGYTEIMSRIRSKSRSAADNGRPYWTTSTSNNCPSPTWGPLITNGLALLNFASVSSSRFFS